MPLFIERGPSSDEKATFRTAKSVANPLKDPICREVLGKLIEMLRFRDDIYRSKVREFEEKHPISWGGIVSLAKAEFFGETPAYDFIDNSVGPTTLVNQFPLERQNEVSRALSDLLTSNLVYVGIIGGPLAPRRALELTDLARALFTRSEQPDFLPAQ